MITQRYIFILLCLILLASACKSKKHIIEKTNFHTESVQVSKSLKSDNESLLNSLSLEIDSIDWVLPMPNTFSFLPDSPLSVTPPFIGGVIKGKGVRLKSATAHQTTSVKCASDSAISKTNAVQNKEEESSKSSNTAYDCTLIVIFFVVLIIAIYVIGYKPKAPRP